MENTIARRSSWPPRTRSQQPILLAVQTNILDDGNETTVVLLRLANAGAENTKKVSAGDTGGWNRGVDFGGGGEWLAGWDGGRAAGACLSTELLDHAKRFEHSSRMNHSWKKLTPGSIGACSAASGELGASDGACSSGSLGSATARSG